MPPQQPQGPPVASGPTENTENKNQQSPPDWITWASGLSNIVIALVTIALAVVAWKQAGYMRDGLAHTSRSIDLATLEKRAWLTVEIQKPIWLGPRGEIMNLGVCPIVIANCGLTPAINASVRFNGNIKGATFDDQVPSRLLAERSSGAGPLPDMAPRSEHRMQVAVARDDKFLPFVSGIVDYHHSGGAATGETWFCVQFADDRMIYREGENRMR